jgi:hypothetical protein
MGRMFDIIRKEPLIDSRGAEARGNEPFAVGPGLLHAVGSFIHGWKCCDEWLHHRHQPLGPFTFLLCVPWINVRPIISCVSTVRGMNLNQLLGPLFYCLAAFSTLLLPIVLL